MSTKRTSSGIYAYDDDEDYVPVKVLKTGFHPKIKVDPTKGKHSLDSDEVDDAVEGIDSVQGKPFDVLKDDDIEGNKLTRSLMVATLIVLLTIVCPLSRVA